MYDNHLANRVFIIVFTRPILYKDYFMLTKLVHNSFINFQINNFTSCNSNASIFILLTPPLFLKSQYIISKTEISLNDFKLFLTNFKKLVNRRYKTINSYMEVQEIDKKLTFIEQLVNENEEYKRTSIRQIKSAYIRKKDFLNKKYSSDPCSKLHTALDLVYYFYTKFEQKWSCITLFDWPALYQETTEQSTDMNVIDTNNLF